MSKRPTKIKFTGNQTWTIIDQAKGDLLVSAAAGSGKTAVLTERLLQRAIAGETIDAFKDWSQVLVLTFTDKAARQMKARLLQKLRDYREDPATLCSLAEIQELHDMDLGEVKERLRRLEQSLPLASVSTIHSFCLDQLRRHPELYTDVKGKIIFEPGFGMLPTNEAEVLLQQSLDQELHQRYSALDRLDGADGASDMDANSARALLDFRALSFFISDTYDDKALRDTVISLYRDLRSLDGYRELLTDQLALQTELARLWVEADRDRSALTSLRPALPAAFQEQIRQFVSQVLDRARPEIKDASRQLKVLISHPYHTEIAASLSKSKPTKEAVAMDENWGSWVGEWQRFLGQTFGSAEEEWMAWHELAQGLQKHPLPRLVRRGKETKLDFIDLLRSAFDRPLALMGQLKHSDLPPYFTLSLDDLICEELEQAGIRAALYQLMIDLDLRYDEAKRRRQAADYSDLEHGALAVIQGLYQKQDQRKDVPEDQLISEVAPAEPGALSPCPFRELYIDEYQDTSPIQEAILHQIPCDRRFMVGDLKQSIYRFRNADPDLFRQKMETYQKHPGMGKDPANGLGSGEVLSSQRQIYLQQNFRSAPHLLDILNHFFRFLMVPEVAELDYDEGQELKPGRETVLAAVPRVRMIYCAKPEKTGDDQGQAVDGTVGTDPAQRHEVRRVVQLVQQAHRAGRPYESIAILARTNGQCGEYIKALEDAGIPAVGGVNKEVLESEELDLFCDFLKLLLQPRNDHALAAFMLSPLSPVRFDEDDCLTIALHGNDQGRKQAHRYLDGEAYFWRNVRDYAEDGEDDELRQRCDHLLNTLSGWREGLATRGAGDLLQEIVDQSLWRHSLALDRMATARLERLDKILASLIKQERTQALGLEGFLTLLETTRSRSGEWEDFAITPAEAAAVKVMTMHASKGLEFDVVIAPSLGTRLKLGRASTSMVQFSLEAKRFSYRYLDGGTGGRKEVEYDSPFMALEKQLQYDRDLAEACRLFYVVMTRAKEELYLVAEGENDLADQLEKIAGLRAHFDQVIQPGQDPVAVAENTRTTVASEELVTGLTRIGFRPTSEAAKKDLIINRRSLNSYWRMLLFFMEAQWPEACGLMMSGEGGHVGRLCSFEVYLDPADPLIEGPPVLEMAAPLFEAEGLLRKIKEALTADPALDLEAVREQLAGATALLQSFEEAVAPDTADRPGCLDDGKDPEEGMLPAAYELDQLMAYRDDLRRQADGLEKTLGHSSAEAMSADTEINDQEADELDLSSWDVLPGYDTDAETIKRWVDLMEAGIDRPELLSRPAKITVTEWVREEHHEQEEGLGSAGMMTLLPQTMQDMVFILDWPEDCREEMEAVEARAKEAHFARQEGQGPQGEQMQQREPVQQRGPAPQGEPVQLTLFDLQQDEADQLGSRQGDPSRRESREDQGSRSTPQAVGPDPRVFGTLAHRFMQLVDLSKLAAVKGPATEVCSQQTHRPDASAADPLGGGSPYHDAVVSAIADLYDEGLLTGEEAALLAVNAGLFSSFFIHPLGQRLLRAVREGRPVYRELPFTMSAGDPEDMKDGLVLVQGMVDLAFIEQDKVILLDYKTDRLHGPLPRQDEEMKDRYGLQITAYAEALRRGIKLPCEERYLFLLRQGRAVDCSASDAQLPSAMR